jgi:NTP pyrophosphatase (non-canonical NTP hydrolase)
MIDMKKYQEDLWAWENEHFPMTVGHLDHLGLGMSEEMGEIFESLDEMIKMYQDAAKMTECIGRTNHMILKSIQKVREGKEGLTDEIKDKIADGVFDTLIYGMQLLSEIGVEFEPGFSKTAEKVLKRDWNAYRANKIKEEY